MAETLRETWNDTETDTRREFWTDGEWIKVGRDVDDPSLCLIFRYDDELYNTFRRGDHPFTITIEDDRGSDAKYLVNRSGHGTFRFFKDRNLVLEVNDHELGTIRTAYRKTADLRSSEYDYEDIARSHIQGLFPRQLMLEITEIDVAESKPRGMVSVEHEYETARINENFIDNVKDSPFTEWTGVYHDLEDDCHGFRYRFSVDAESIRESEQ